MLWPRSLTDTTVLSEKAQREGFLLENSKIIGFKESIAPARTSSLHTIESKGVITLPCKVAINDSERYSLRMRDSANWRPD